MECTSPALVCNVNMKFLSITFLFVIQATVGICQNYFITTSPPSEAEKDVYIVAEVGDTIEIICNITADNGGNPPTPIVVNIVWTLNENDVLAFSLGDNTASGFTYLSTSDANSASYVDLTVTNFTKSMDRMQLKCADVGDNVGATYVFGIAGELFLK